jgi:ABC-2 type transport system permease protein
LSPWGVPSVVFGLILLFYAGHHAGLTAGMYALGIIPLVLSLIILYSLWYILATTTVWFVKIQNVTQVLQNAMEAGKYPMAAYPVALRFFFTFILPVGFLTTAPAEIMLGRSSTVGWLIGAFLLAVMTFSFSRFFWRFALRSYTSASS